MSSTESPDSGRHNPPAPDSRNTHARYATPFDVDDLRTRLSRHIDDLITHLYPEARNQGHEWHLGSILGGEDKSCTIGRDRLSAGVWQDRSSEGLTRSGDVLDMIAVKLDLSPSESLEWAFDFLMWREDSAGLASTQASIGQLRGAKPSTLLPPLKPASIENLNRQKSKLQRCEAVMAYLHGLGLKNNTIEYFHLGLREPFKSKVNSMTVQNALSFPIIGHDGKPSAHYCMRNIPGITVNPIGQVTWCKGQPLTYWSESLRNKESLIVVGNSLELWLLHQRLAETLHANKIVLICSSHENEIPHEWLSTEFWRSWRKVYFSHSKSEVSEHRIKELIRACGREAKRLSPPESGETWSAYFETAEGTPDHFLMLMRDAPAISDSPPQSDIRETPDTVGDFVAKPININGAYVNGFLYYPFTVEHRSLEVVKDKGGSAKECIVTSYKTKVVRSDGAVLDITLLPAPRGTPRERRVLALTDGTRIERDPQLSHNSTWHLQSIQGFIESTRQKKPASHRPLRELLVDTEAHLRRSAWLPHGEDYTLLCFYIALSFVYQVFPAIPLVMVSGDKGTGKSALGEAIASVSFNAVMLGQGTAASVVRVLHETRGLAVLDDVEALSRALEKDFSDLNQMLKLSYKKVTGRKALTLPNGKTQTFDFYGPKVINNTRGVDTILGSRMLHIETRQMPELIRKSGTIIGTDTEELFDLRNELHVWGMANARVVECVYKRMTSASTDRISEISVPLRVLAEMADDQRLSGQLEAALERQSRKLLVPKKPAEILREAVNNCIRQGARSRLSSAHLKLELSLLAQTYGSDQTEIWRNSEWLGHKLRQLRIRDVNQPVRRARLYGKLKRIYALNKEYVGEVLRDIQLCGEKKSDEIAEAGQMEHPFDFCMRISKCESCSYQFVCPTTIPGLMDAKLNNRQETISQNLTKAY
jgi:hypothetical protein